ncbi:PEP-CTERM sorting domain-containing protein [Thioalkalivibrio sp. ALJ1]|uniref:PEP-CTERM sorting domain-containing protein n=1 Tax=Thioalkalivibrio sp. ALJ1 TaxID=1158144 RepID=UPI00056F8517|nr:PEP-CTERM sorting domain-containing protein [Thioalkalivibrio sp. ALJ1]
MLKRTTLFSALAMVASSALAAPEFDRFGELSQADFGGSGIPNDAVAISDFRSDFGFGTVGLSAAQRFDSPTVTDDGAGTFFANPGESDPGLSLWNFNFYMSANASFAAPGDVETDEIQPEPIPGGLMFQVQYDINPGSGSDIGTIDIPVLFDDEGLFEFQGSQNLGFNYLNEGGVPGVTPPDGSFDPFAVGLYEFTLVAFDSGNPDMGNEDLELARSTINVQVGDPAEVPLPATLGLFGLGLLALGAARLRRRS